MTDRKPRVLIADDRPDVVEALAMLLRPAGIEVSTASSPALVVARAEAEVLDAAIIDLNYTRDTTSGREGLDLLTRLRQLDGLLPVVVMTAYGNVEGAVEAMRRGARDYVQKPWDNERLLTTIAAQIELSRAMRRSRRVEAETGGGHGRELPPLIAESRAMATVVQILERVAPSDAGVLITGEHGTGKDVMARWIHARSRRADRAYVPVHAGALAEGVVESELFGHVRGAFTDARADRVGSFEQADGGTLFLDEIATMPVAQQSKLLRALQVGEFHPVGSSVARRADVRVLAATNATVAREVAEGRLREDLLYRLNTFEIHMPPLRERREDLPLLAGSFLARHAARYGGPVPELATSAMQALLAHRWPGNIRELEHVIERACLMARGCPIEEHDLLLRPRGGAATAIDEMSLEEAEQTVIVRELRRAGGNVTDTARSLGMSRSALYRRLHQYGIKVAP